MQQPASKPEPAPLAYVLDDEPAVGVIICHALRKAGFEAEQFSNALPFLTQVKVAPPLLIALDLALGETDAVEVIRKLEVLKYAGSVLLISGRDEGTLAEMERIGRSRGLRMLRSVQKPFVASDVKQRLSEPVEMPAGPPDAAPPPRRPNMTLAEGLANDWLELWYQPKVDLGTLAVCGAEALLRGRHPQHGICSPGDLLPPAGDPLYRPLSNFVVRSVIRDWHRLAHEGLFPTLSVNVPASVLHGAGFVEVVRPLVPRDPRFPGLIIEVTEDEVIRDPGWVREVAIQLRLCNAKISIDDFGSAYASMSRLTDLPFVELKLDRSFVADCASNQVKRSMCQSIIELGHKLGATICAEGVESAVDAGCLRELGCDTAQGYLFAKPMPLDSFTTALKRWPERTS